MAEKRRLEFESLSGVSEAESADIDGVIASVSPMKRKESKQAISIVKLQMGKCR